MEAGERTYECPVHGLVEVFVSMAAIEAGEVFEQPCPHCGKLSELRQPRTRGLVVGSAPAVHGDIRKPFYSPFVNRMITTRSDLSRAYRELNVAPMTDADLKAEAERTETVMSQKKADDAWAQRAAAMSPKDRAMQPDAPAVVEFDKSEPVTGRDFVPASPVLEYIGDDE